jgi:hypothetical protein
MDFQARMNALSTGDKVVGAGLLIALISLFLPWYGWSVNAGAFGSLGGSESGFYGVGWVYLLLLLACAVYWGMKVFAPDADAFKQVSSVGKRPDGSGGIGHWQVFLGAGVVMFLFSLIYYFSNISGSGTGYSYGVRWGWFIGLIGAIVIAVGGFMARDAGAGFGLGAPSTGSRAASTLPSSPPPPTAPPPAAPVDTNVNAGPPTTNEPAQSTPPQEPTEPAP